MSDTRILVVEDQSLVARDIRDRLESLGYTVCALAASGEEAVRKVAELRPDLVLMDIVLKGEMDGVAAADHIRGHFNIPVVYLTAHSDEATLQKAKLTGPYGYILKPFQERELHIAVEVALHQHKLERELEVLNEDLERRVAERTAQLEAANAELQRERESLQQRSRDLALLNLAGRAISSTLNLDQVLITILGETRRLLNVAACSVWLIDSRTGQLVCRQAAGPGSEVVRGWRLSIGEGIAGQVACNGESLIVPDAQADQRHSEGVYRQTRVLLRSILSVPLRSKRGVIGVLQVTDLEVNRFDSTHLVLIEPLAASAAVAIENTQLYKQSQQEIAERKRAQEALRRAHDELEVRVYERTIELKRANEELALARDQAMEASRLKSQLLATVSHDLRSPLAAILGYADMLQAEEDGSLTDMQWDIVRRTIATARQMLSQMNNLLDRAQIEAGELRFNIASFDPADLLNDIHLVMSGQAQAKGLELVAHIAEEVPATLQGDSIRLHQILSNLVGNAIKFTEQGTVRLEIFCPDAGHWALRVSDTGPGISPEDQVHIFEAFRQVEDSATHRREGWGLGLFIVKQLVSLMEGEIVLESEEGQGSTFTVTLPIRE